MSIPLGIKFIYSRTWENVVRKCNLHRMYRALKSVNERKDVFKKFIDDIKEKEEVIVLIILDTKKCHNG